MCAKPIICFLVGLRNKTYVVPFQKKNLRCFLTFTRCETKKKEGKVRMKSLLATPNPNPICKLLSLRTVVDNSTLVVLEDYGLHLVVAM